MTNAASSTAGTSISSVTSTASATCVSVKPGKNGYLPPEACGNILAYVPSLAAAVIFCVLFGGMLIAHAVQGFLFKKRFCWVIVMGAAWELLAMVFRALLTQHQNKSGYDTANQLLFLLAPLWINAFLYMLLGRLIYFFEGEKRLAGLSAVRLGTIFVLLDILSFIVQAAGAIFTTQENASKKTIEMGIHIYMGGIGLQEFFILCFSGLTIMLHRRVLMAEQQGLNKEKMDRGAIPWRWLFYAMYEALFMITIRIIYRLAEYSRGTDPSSPTVSHEWFQYVWDALPMFLALLILSIFHPGRVLIGTDSEFPRISRAEKKRLKREKKEMKAAQKAAKKAAKKTSDYSMISIAGSSIPFDRLESQEEGNVGQRVEEPRLYTTNVGGYGTAPLYEGHNTEYSPYYETRR